MTPFPFFKYHWGGPLPWPDKSLWGVLCGVLQNLILSTSVKRGTGGNPLCDRALVRVVLLATEVWFSLSVVRDFCQPCSQLKCRSECNSIKCVQWVKVSIRKYVSFQWGLLMFKIFALTVSDSFHLSLEKWKELN